MCGSKYISHKRIIDQKGQSVKEHCDKVAVMAEAWGKAAGAPSLCRLCGKLHDMGKESEEFLFYLLYSFENPEDLSRKGTVDHGQAGGKYIFEQFHDSADVLDKITAEIVAMIVCFHHGGLSDYVDLSCNLPLKNRIDKDISNYGQIKNNFLQDCYSEEELKYDFSCARSEVESFINWAKLSEINFFGVSLLTKFVYSCIIDADRLDAYLFSINSTEKTVDKTELWERLSLKMECFVGQLKKVYAIDDLRKEISDTCKNFAKRAPGIYYLTVPTGGGKTISGFRYALQHAKIYGKERIIYVAPFTTIIDQNAKQIKEILQCDDMILEHHSSLVRDNKDEDYKLMTERWDAPMIFTTMVQFLNTVFQGGTQSVRRMHHLADAVILFDEVQALPVSCISLFNQTLNFLSNICGTTCILCTATQPALGETERPIIPAEHGEIITNLSETFAAFKRVEVVDKIKLGGYSIERIADLITEELIERNSALTIVNTKKAAKKLYQQLSTYNRALPEEEKIQIYHLSTNMCPSHRMKVLEQLKNALSNLDDGGKPVVCISTQLIEAGVDISFKCVFRAIAGLDSIAQAVGRCNRHGEAGLGKAYIFNLENENLSMLPEIEKGVECTKQCLNEFKTAPQRFDNDILSPKAINEYYKYYYGKLKHKMDFPIKDTETSIYALLGRNEKGVSAYHNKYGEGPDLRLHQAHKTAGQAFFVIPGGTIDVVVPYDEGKSLICDLNGKCSLEQAVKLSKKAQRYSVSLFKHEQAILERSRGIYLLANGGILAIAPEFYDDELGLIIEGKGMGFLDM